MTVTCEVLIYRQIRGIHFIWNSYICVDNLNRTFLNYQILDYNSSNRSHLTGQVSSSTSNWSVHNITRQRGKYI